MPGPLSLQSDPPDGSPDLPNQSALLAEWLYRPIAFEHPERIVDPDSWVTHIPFAFWLMDVARPATLVELGTHSGNSYAAFAQAIKDLGLSTAAYAVDTWQGDAQAGFYGESVFEEWEAYHVRFAAFSRLVRSTFEEAVAHFDDGTIDVLHIDGCHTFEAVSADFAQWRPKLSGRGVVLFHDTNVRERDFGVWRFWQELKGEYPSFEFLHGHGLGVLGIGAKQPDALCRLFASAQREAEARAIRAFFAALGSGIQARHRAKVVAELHAEAQAASGRAQVAAAEEIAARTAEAAQLNEALAAARQEADEAASQVAIARDVAAVTERELAERDRQIKRRRTERRKLAAALEAKEQARVRLVTEVDELRRRARVVKSDTPGAAARSTPLVAIGRLQEKTESMLRRRLRVVRRLARAAAALGLIPSRQSGIRPASATLLLAPARLRDAYLLVASGLFDEGYYLACNADVAASGTPPLAHFVRRGGLEGRSPHPLFDPAYYRRQNPDLAGTAVNPLVHYCRFGAREGRSPHPLFDVPFYLARNPDVRDSGLEPLSHFLRSGAAEGRDPNPLFDCVYYLQSNPDVAADGSNPLIHFGNDGWREGRRPSPGFDPGYYLATNQDVADAGYNPLSHYVELGRSEGRWAVPPDEDDKTQPAPASEPPPMIMTVRSLAARPAAPPVIVCLSHVMPLPPRAGNEYRILRMWRWLRDRGYQIVPVVAPLPGERLDDDAVHRLAAEFSNGVICDRSGAVQYILGSVPDALASLSGDVTRPVSLLLDEDSIRGRHQRDLLQMDRIFCHDVLISTVTRLEQALGPHVVLAEYIWMTRLLPLLGRDVIKVVDTIDVFSTKRDKVLRFGVDDLHVDPAEEARRLRRADLIIAIQEDERRELARLVPRTPVITAGVDFDVTGGTPPTTRPRVLYVASANPMNRKGLNDFLRFAWPRVRQEVADAELVLAGDIGASVTADVPGVIRLGRVPDLAPLYRDARLVINPAAAGTGVKIKTLEALGYFRPVVTWPSGVDGIAPELSALCHVVHDWYTFGRRLSALLVADPPLSFSAEQQDLIRRCTAPDATYRGLTEALATMIEQRWGAPPAVPAAVSGEHREG